MTSTNTATHEVAYYWFAWVSMHGIGRVFASGTVTGPRDYTRAAAVQDITTWLADRSCTCARQDITLTPADLPATHSPRKG